MSAINNIEEILSSKDELTNPTPDKNVLKCLTCFKTFARKYYLKTHERIIHQNLKPFACQNCSKKFGKERHLKIHVQMVHEKLKPFECQFCSSKFEAKITSVFM
jgi:uncharacterized Zn-finger protein